MVMVSKGGEVGGLVSPAAWGLLASELGEIDAQQVPPLVGSHSEMQIKKKINKRSLLPLGRAGSSDKMVPFWTRAAVARWQGWMETDPARREVLVPREGGSS